MVKINFAHFRGEEEACVLHLLDIRRMHLEKCLVQVVSLKKSHCCCDKVGIMQFCHRQGQSVNMFPKYLLFELQLQDKSFKVGFYFFRLQLGILEELSELGL